MYKKIIDERYGGLDYEINEKGIVRNIKTKKEISQQDHNGYKVVNLSKDGLDIKKRVHRLIAIAFLDKKEFKSMPNENREEIDLNSLEVNHIDLNRKNNDISNLEWCTAAYNRYHGYINNSNYCRKKAVIGINKETKEIEVFESLYMAGKSLLIENIEGNKLFRERKINQKSNCIRNVCNKKQTDTHGCYWFWYNEDILKNPDKYINEIIESKRKYTLEQEKLIKDNGLNDNIIRNRVKNFNLTVDEAIKLPKRYRLKPTKKREWKYIPKKNTKVYDGLYKKYGTLTPIEIIKEKGKKAQYRCKCDCGGEVITQYLNVLNGKTKKCPKCR